MAFAGLILAYLAFINETNHSEGLHAAGAEFDGQVGTLGRPGRYGSLLGRQ